MKRRKVRFRERDSACLDRAGREYRVLVDDYGNLENILEQVNEELEAHGLENVLGDDPDYCAFRIERNAEIHGQRRRFLKSLSCLRRWL
jgi:hypothetical protein